MKSFIVLLALMAVALFAATTLATPIQQLQQLNPQAELEPQQAPTFTNVVILTIDGETINWEDSQDHPADAKKPLFIYETPCTMSFVAPLDALPGDKATMNFIWCEEDDKKCEASTSVRVAETTITGPAAPANVTFSIPHLSWTKYFSSYIEFDIEQTRPIDGRDTFISIYQSQYIYPSDIASKGTKTVVIVVAVFCSVLVAMALAVLGYMIFKKVKKMRRQRHFPTKDHNLYRR